MNELKLAPTDYLEWSESQTHAALEFQRRMKFGEAGNPENPWIAARLAFEAGVEAGKTIALQRLAKMVIS